MNNAEERAKNISLMEYLDIHHKTRKNVINQKERVKEALRNKMDKHQRVLLVSSDIYSPQPTAVVTITALYNNFASGYVLNKLSGDKIPYTINYYSLIANDFSIESSWERESLIEEEENKEETK